MKLEKAILRRRILCLRRSLSFKEIEEGSEKIEERLHVLSIFCRARAVLFYLALKDEVQTQGMIKEAFKLNKIVVVPLIKLKERNILPVRLNSLNEGFILGPLGIQQPKGNLHHPVPLDEIDLVIVPGVAFDRRGNRLGFGMGFYDRFLRKVSLGTKTLALAFEVQLVTSIPSQPHDMRVEYIVTEERVINCSSSGISDG